MFLKACIIAARDLFLPDADDTKQEEIYCVKADCNCTDRPAKKQSAKTPANVGNETADLQSTTKHIGHDLTELWPKNGFGRTSIQCQEGYGQLKGWQKLRQVPSACNTDTLLKSGLTTHVSKRERGELSSGAKTSQMSASLGNQGGEQAERTGQCYQERSSRPSRKHQKTQNFALEADKPSPRQTRASASANNTVNAYGSALSAK